MKWPWQKEPEPAVVPVEKKPMAISSTALALSGARAPAFPIEDVFTPLRPMSANALPSGIAMDSIPALASPVTNWAISAMAGVYHEGIRFLGYPYLAQLAQRVEYRHACEIYAEHATRKWIKLRGDDAKVKKIDDEFKRLDIRATFSAAAMADGLFGRSQVFLDFDDANDEAELKTELIVDKGKVNARRPLKRLKLVEPMWSYPAPYSTQNPLAADFYEPSAWYVYGKTIHATRLLTIVGREVPDMLKPAYAFGGQALTALMKPYVDNWLRTRQSVSDLLHSFSVMVLGTDMETVLAGGAGSDLANRVAMFNNYRDNNGLMVLNKATEELTNIAAPIAGLEGLQGQSQEQLASAARIPLSIYLQITPTGLNASSEGEIRSFYSDVHAYQEKCFRSPIQRILELVQLSLFGTIDPEIGFDFEPLWEMSDKDLATIRKSDAEADKIYIDAGVVDNEEARDRLRNDESSLYHGVDLSAPAPEPEEDDGDDSSSDQNGGRDEGDDA